MALVKPFKGLFYNDSKVDLCDVSTLPYDVISSEKREKYAEKSDLSFINLILPEGGEDEKYEKSRQLMEKWISENIICEEEKECFYWYEEEYMGNGGKINQKGVIAKVKLEAFENNVILPHEEIYSGPMQDRYNLLKATNADLEMIMGIYADSSHLIKSICENHGEQKISLYHEDEITHTIHRICDMESVDKITNFFKDKQIIIADGHHRYTTALKYHIEDNGSKDQYILMWLLEIGDTRIFPTHRMLENIPDESNLKERLSPYFDLKELSGKDELQEKLNSNLDNHSFGFYSKDLCLLLTLKDNDLVDDVLSKNGNSHWRDLDVNIAHAVIIQEILDLTEDTKHIHFIKDNEKMFAQIDEGRYSLALLMNPTHIEDVLKISGSGKRMPQKSTYFYPKPLSGLIFRRHDSE